MSLNQTTIRAVLVTIALIVAMATHTTAQEQTGPRLKCATEIFDFGYVPQDATVSHTYWLRNTGTETVEIKQIKPNCGCTRVPPVDSTIAPGDSLPVEIIFASRNITGKVEKFTRIVSNVEGRSPALTFRSLVVKDGENPAPIRSTPAVVNLNGGTTARVTIRNVSRDLLVAKVVDGESEFIRLPISELTLAPEESKELSFEIIPQKNTDEFEKSITLETNDPAKSRITIPITNIKKE
jgi:hypothetical protein